MKVLVDDFTPASCNEAEESPQPVHHLLYQHTESRHYIVLLSALICIFSAFLVKFPQIKCLVHIPHNDAYDAIVTHALVTTRWSSENISVSTKLVLVCCNNGSGGASSVTAREPDDD